MDNNKIRMFCELHIEEETVFSMSRERWKAAVFSKQSPHHGEKFNQMHQNQASFRCQTLICQNTNLKQENTDTDIFQCVNPYEVNPVPHEVDSEIAQSKSKLENVLVQLPKASTRLDCGGFYKHHLLKKDSQTIKLEMETFDDLSPYIPPMGETRAEFAPADELNTPIFEMARPAFFTQPNEFEPPEMEEFKFDANALNSTFLMSSNDSTMFENIPSNSELVGNNNNFLSYNIFMSQLCEDHTYYNKNIKINNTPTNLVINNKDQESIAMFNSNCDNSIFYNNNYDVTSVDSNNGYTSYSNASSPMEDTTPTIVYQHGYETPENTSDSSISMESTPHTKPNLKLNLTNNTTTTLTKKFTFSEVNDINTPDIIDTVQSLEANQTFNILDYISNKEILTVNADELLELTSKIETPSTSDLKVSKPPTGKPLALLKATRPQSIPQKQPRNRYIPEKRPRKRKTSYESDDEYIPPTKKMIPTKYEYITEEEDSCTDDEFSVTAVVVKPSTSKRRAKIASNRSSRSSSINSEIKDCDGYKYRELRDKNNEASRKSRQKRKIKEMVLEKEADELDEKNIKLKAQVSELERMVNTFRDNLFSLMMKK